MSAMTYNSPLEYLCDELHRIKRLIHRQITHFRQKFEYDQSGLRGVYIGDEEVDSILNNEITGKKRDVNQDVSEEDYNVEYTRRIRQKAAQTALGGMEIRLLAVRDLFQLSDFDFDVFLMCLAPEIFQQFARLYAYLQDDITRKNASIGMILDTLCDGAKEKIERRRSFLPSSPLLKNFLIKIWCDPSRPAESFLNQFVMVDKRMSDFVLGGEENDRVIEADAHIRRPLRDFSTLLLPNRSMRLLRDFCAEIHNGGDSILYLFGPQGTGKKHSSEAIAFQCKKPLVIVDTVSLLACGDVFIEKVNRAFREAALAGAIIVWDHFDVLLSDDKASVLTEFIERIHEYNRPLIFTGRHSWYPGASFGNRPYRCIAFSYPDAAQRLKLWNTAVNGHVIREREAVLDRVSGIFNLTGDQIRHAAKTAGFLSSMDSNESIIREDHLFNACRIHSSAKLNQLAQRISPKYCWEDIVLPRETMQQLKDLCAAVKYRHTVLEQWGFGLKCSRGKGIGALFAGPSGTGKTMAAEVIANDLGMDLYKIDLSTVVSKYIGETEKNLSRIFNEAESANGILFFDEADALLGKRSEVKDAHDRYANIEISFLLQKMEEYDGVTVLATNLKQNIDQAFFRRIRAIVEFPFPDEEFRFAIWRIAFPKKAPVSEEIDWGFLAKKFKLSGGNIKNIVINAAFLAASESVAISMPHLMVAAKREYGKLGMNFLEADYKPYYSLAGGGISDRCLMAASTVSS